VGAVWLAHVAARLSTTFFLLFSGVRFFHAAVPLVGPCWFTRLFRVFVSAAGSLEYIVSSTLSADVHAYFKSCHGLSQQWSGTVENPHWLCSANGRSRAKENYGVRAPRVIIVFNGRHKFYPRHNKVILVCDLVMKMALVV